MTTMTQQNQQPKHRILCVDDDPATIDIYGRYLAETDYEMISAESAEEGFHLALERRPDIIISDVVMMAENGLDFCKRVKETPVLQNVIFILASAVHVDSSDTIKGIESGADDYLYKPVRQVELIAKIKAFLRIKTLQDQLRASNRKLNKAMGGLEEYQRKLEENNQVLAKEKKMLQNSLKQIQLMVEERELANRKLEALNKAQMENFNGLISILSATIESKRQYHRGHSKKVAEIATFIARELKLPKPEIRNIEIAALLHELGKLSIPDELALKNPKEYTQTEKDFLSRHPVEGATLLEKFPGFRRIAEIIRHFNENVDGTGVPDGLRGEHIPVGSRIIAAANLFENLMYRKKEENTESAFEAIEETAGTRLDAGMLFYLHKYAASYPVKESEKAKAVRLIELKAGMTLAAGIFSAKGAKLVPRNTVLTEELIQQLAQFNKREPIRETAFVK